LPYYILFKDDALKSGLYGHWVFVYDVNFIPAYYKIRIIDLRTIFKQKRFQKAPEVLGWPPL
jgi:hypothetical protein